MKGVKFDKDQLEKGLPIKFKCYGADIIGLVAGVEDKVLKVMAYDYKKEKFWVKEYGIKAIDELQILAHWKDDGIITFQVIGKW